MQCPYCISEVPDEAVVCKACGRDLYLLKPLLEKVAELEAIAAQVPVLEAELAAVRLTVAPAPLSPSPERLGARLGWPLFALLAPLVLLLLAHGLIIIVFDLNPLYLRVVSLLLPLPFAWLFARRRAGSGLAGTLLALVLAVLAVLGMSALTGWVDQTPVLPQDALEWREFAEFAASVAFSFITGLLLGRVRPAGGARGQHATELVTWLAGNLNLGGLTLPEKVEHLHELGGKLIALGTTVLSIYTGLKSFVG